jgi:diguanylate cyclase (GGDEF)-like protein
MSSSYASDGAADEPDPAPGAIPGGWLPSSEASEGWPASRHVWADAIALPSPAPVAPEVEPFEYPAPTSLEQRAASADVDEDAGDDDADDADWDDEDETFDADADVDDTEIDEEDEGDMEATPEMTAATAELDTEDDAEIEPRPRPRPLVNGSPLGRDPLTGMLDAAAFEEVMAHEDSREQRYGRPATVIVFELDGLTKLVDRLGTEPGDRIETALGDTIRRLARRADHVARLERGRYAVLLPETDEVAAINYVERIRRACDLWLESGAIAMRLAIGWASTGGDAGLNGAIRLATDRMRVEMRRNARGVGDVAPDLELIEGDGAAEGDAAEAASGL